MFFWVLSVLIGFTSLAVQIRGFAYLEFPSGPREYDATANMVHYRSAFAYPKQLDIDVFLNLTTSSLVDVNNIGKVNCVADAYDVYGKPYSIFIPVPPDQQNSAFVHIVHNFKPGNYTITFFMESNKLIVGQATFHLRETFYFAQTHPVCWYSHNLPPNSDCNRLTLGKGTYHNFDYDYTSRKPWNITVGKFTSISNVKLMLARSRAHRMEFITTFPLHTMLLPEREILDEVVHGSSHSITIGNDVWIGKNSILINNITIGHGAIIGAESVVRTKVPPYAIVYGNPAVVMKYRFPPEIVSKLLAMQWWDWEDRRIMQMVNYNTTEQVIDAYERGLI